MKNLINKKKVTIIVVAILVLVLTIGGAYALWTYSKTLGNQVLISGDIFLKYTEGDTINIKEAMPSITYNPDEYFEFSIEGRNRYKKDIVFEILLDEGDQPTGDENKTRTERIKPELLKFRLVEVKTDEEGNKQEEELIQEASYDSIQKRRIWVDRVKAGTKENIKYTYRLYMWISSDAKIGNMPGADYTAEVWNNNVYASVKVGVNGDFNEKELTEDYMILNAVNESGQPYDLKQPVQSDEDITVTLGSKREVTSFVISKSSEYPIALMSLDEPTTYPASYNKETRAWEAKVTLDETGIYDYYAIYPNAKGNSKTYSFSILMNPDRFVKVEKPTEAMCKPGLIYNGKTQDLVENISPAGYTYKNHQQKDANTYQITATLIDKFRWADSSEGEVTFSCSISPKELTVTPRSGQSMIYGDVEQDLTYDYTGQAEDDVPVFSGKLGRAEGDTKGTYLINQGNLELTNGENFKASNYTLKFSETPVNFTIEPKPVTNVTVNLGSTDFTYNGNQHQPAVTSVLDGSKTLNLTTDYTVSYSNNTNAGVDTAKVIITGQNNYTGTKEVPFTIKQVQTTLTFEPVSGISVQKGAKGTFKINASIAGTFNVTSRASGTASVTFTPATGTSTTVTVSGVVAGSTTLDVTFTPTDNVNYKGTTGTYSIMVTSSPGVSKLKDKLGAGGLVGIPTNCNEESCTPIIDKNADKSTIREYRYSGGTVNNYVYFNCKDNLPQNASNCETWRIVGIFKDDNGNDHMKIVQNQVMPESVLPSTYVAAGKTFKIKSSGTKAYWDYDGSAYDNNWADAGLMNWLNSRGTDSNDVGYLNKLSSTSQNMIADTNYYLGNVTYYDNGSNGGSYSLYGIKDTAIEAYTNERGSKACSSTSLNGCQGGYIWPNNEATWPGKIALLYPSDIGFSTDSSYWNTKLGAGTFNGTASKTSWLTANHTSHEYLLSPISRIYTYVAFWHSSGYLNDNPANRDYEVRASLYLKSNVQIIDGQGTSGEPYLLSGN